MNKFLLALMVCAFTVNAFACGGSGKGEEDKKRFDTIKTNVR